MRAAAEAALRDHREGRNKHPIRQSDAVQPLVTVAADELAELLKRVT